MTHQVLSLRLTVALLALLALAAPGSAASVSLSAVQRVEVRDALTDAAQRVANRYVESHGLKLTPAPRVEVELEFDEARLVENAAAHEKTWADRRATELAAQRQALRDIAKELEAKPATAAAAAPAAAAPAGDAKTGGLRLGRLNVDLGGDVTRRLLERPSAAPGAPQTAAVALELQAPHVELVTPPFQFAARDYVAWATVKVALPADAPTSLEAGLTAALVQALELKSFPKAKPEAELVKLERLPAIVAASAVQKFTQGLLDPQSPLIGLLFLALFGGVAMILAARALAGGVRGIAHEIKGLKPEPAAGEGGGGEADAGPAAHAASEEVMDAHTVESDTRTSYDLGHAAQALTAEMQTLRAQVEDLIAQHQQVFVELLRDMLDTPVGLAHFKDLLGFVGYRALKPAMDALPTAAIRRLQDFVESAQETPPNLLNGAEVVQRLYGACVSKISLGSDGTPAMAKLRGVLVRLEDAQLTTHLGALGPLEVAALLRCLTVERGNRLMRKLAAEVLRDASALLDKEWSAADEAQVEALADKLAAEAPTAAAASGEQRRLILRLARSVGIDEESAITGLVAADDWELKRNIFQSRFLFADTPYLPAKLLRTIVGSFDLPTRAELVLVGGDALKDAILAMYASGSKQREMLDAELALIEKNAAKADEVQKRRLKTLGSFMERVRKAVAADPSIVDSVIMKQCEALSLTPPPELQAAFDLIAQSRTAA